MKAVHVSNATVLSDKQREKLSGCRVENADAFGGVSSGVTEALILGDYPQIEKAYEDLDLQVEDVKDPNPPKKKAKK